MKKTKKNPVKVKQGKKLQQGLKDKYQEEIKKEAKKIINKKNEEITMLKRKLAMKPKVEYRTETKPDIKKGNINVKPTIKLSLFDKFSIFPSKDKDEDTEKKSIRQWFRRVFNLIHNNSNEINTLRNENSEMKGEIYSLKKNIKKLNNKIEEIKKDTNR